MDEKQSTKTNQTTPKHNHMKHGIMMLACCLIPIALIGIFSLLGFKFRSLGSLAILICPLMHIVMMLGMRKSKGKAPCCSHDQTATTNTHTDPL